MTVQVYNPFLNVIVTKLVTRQNGLALLSGAPKRIDLTPFLSESGSVQTTKSTDPGTVGAFSITFGDSEYDAISDTTYAAIEPMDLVEIRASRTPENYSAKVLPLIMRGFVSRIQRHESMTDAGPSRLVTITGQDMGKLANNAFIFYELLFLTDKPFVTQWKLNATTGITVAFDEVADFMKQVIDTALNPKLTILNGFAQSHINPIVQDISVPAGNGQVTIATAQNYEAGSVWGLIAMFADRPWNEYFLRDDPADDQTHFVFRPVPYVDISGNLIMPGAADPGSISVDQIDVIDVSLSRSDDNVANFFWTPPDQASLASNWQANTAAFIKGSLMDFSYPNNAPELYELRKMEASTSLYGPGMKIMPRMLPAGVEQTTAIDGFIQWHELRGVQLKALNRDNAVWESGSYVLKGSETLMIGKYLKVTRGALVATSYITSVSHTIQPLGAWTTAVTVERGDGTLVRDRYTGSPAWAEGRPGVYPDP